MRQFIGLLVMLGMLSMLGSPAFARVATIETSVPLADDSEGAMNAAVTEAVDTGVP